MNDTTKKRGRPLAFDKQEALRTAASLFHRKGFDSVGIAELSAAIGVQPPSLYAAFGNKAALFDQALTQYAGGDGKFMARAFEGAANVKAGIRAMLLAAVDQYTKSAKRLGCMVMGNLDCNSDPQAVSTCMDMYRATEMNIRDYIATEYAANADSIAGQVMIALAGLSASARAGKSSGQLTNFANAVAETAFDQ